MLKNKIFSFNTIAIFVGVAGFISAFVTMFVDTGLKISIKWIIFLILISITIIVIASKIIYDLVSDKEVNNSFHEKPINSDATQEILIIKNNRLFNSNSVVGGYWDDNGVETLIFLGFIYHTQELLLQVKVIKLFDSRFKDRNIFQATSFKKIIIRSAIPFNVIDIK